ncbi:hypothetical protein OGAPHI_002857 [Ogataea philodendri]|uniref:Tyrosyl-DNA phosphodiesterase n=1 Tax=Ogataea philodendri TaxID=1378263 RepID=A0A9P8P7J6_9ASCO|nr:uncharacterized protein OGAPHI_002857 [Ogataea philodendri]KAH3667208.1 hypothetical protein OGAPHI_002857 [Ogataea philodendri]
MSGSETDSSIEFIGERDGAKQTVKSIGPEIIDSESEESTTETSSTPNDEQVTEETTGKRFLRDLIADAAEKRQKKSTHTTDTETEKKPIPAPVLKSPIHLISNPSYCAKYPPSSNADTISLGDILGSRILESSYQFNMLIDCDFLLPFFNADPLNFELYLIGTRENMSISDLHQLQYRIRSVDVSKHLPKWGSHHTKMMINFFHDDTCQLVIHTMNLTTTDYLAQTQMCWISPRLKRLKKGTVKKSINDLDPITDSGLMFQNDLKDYLETYKDDRIHSLIKRLDSFCFDPIDVVFIASSPGRYEFSISESDKSHANVNRPKLFGYGRLHQALNQFNLTAKGNADFIMQVSSISAPLDSKHMNIGTHILSSIVEGSDIIVKQPDHKFTNKEGLDLKIVWPTENEVINAYHGHISGHAIMLKTKAVGGWFAYENQSRFLRNFFYKWASKPFPRSEAGRSNLSPHVKTYCVTEDNFSTLKWFLLTSANLSKQAWGAPERGYGASFQNGKLKKHAYAVKSFEAGVLINPKILKVSLNDRKDVVLVPVRGTDYMENASTNAIHYPIRMPYDYPLEKYSKDDKPWIVSGFSFSWTPVIVACGERRSLVSDSFPADSSFTLSSGSFEEPERIDSLRWEFASVKYVDSLSVPDVTVDMVLVISLGADDMFSKIPGARS